jgi:hypothetical protein
MKVQLELDGTVTEVSDQAPRSFVYFVRVAEQAVFKVGISNTPTKRLQGLQTGCPYELQLYATALIRDTKAAEEQVHRILASRQIRGEWFSISPSEVNTILDKFEQTRKWSLPSPCYLTFWENLLCTIGFHHWDQYGSDISQASTRGGPCMVQRRRCGRCGAYGLRRLRATP